MCRAHFDFALAVLLALLGCALPQPPFPDFAGATRVVVLGPGGRDTLAVILDSGRVVAAARFADARNNRWTAPQGGVPVPRVSGGFWRGAEYLGSFGAGPEFFATQREGTFASRRASRSEVAAFAAALGVAAPAGL